jgi:hypothetical protein
MIHLKDADISRDSIPFEFPRQLSLNNVLESTTSNKGPNSMNNCKCPSCCDYNPPWITSFCISSTTLATTLPSNTSTCFGYFKANGVIILTFFSRLIMDLIFWSTRMLSPQLIPVKYSTHLLFWMHILD